MRWLDGITDSMDMSEQALGDGEGQGSPVCSNSKVSDTSEQLNNMGFPVMIKTLPAMQETGVQFLGQENPLEKTMAIHSNILAWKIPRTEEPGGLQSVGSQSQTQLSD